MDLSGVGQRGHWDDYGSPLAASLDKDLAHIGQVAKPKKEKERKERGVVVNALTMAGALPEEDPMEVLSTTPVL